MVDWLIVFVIGWREGWSDMGRTYGDPYTSLSVWYDRGRALRRWRDPDERA